MGGCDFTGNPVTEISAGLVFGGDGAATDRGGAFGPVGSGGNSKLLALGGGGGFGAAGRAKPVPQMPCGRNRCAPATVSAQVAGAGGGAGRSPGDGSDGGAGTVIGRAICGVWPLW